MHGKFFPFKTFFKKFAYNKKSYTAKENKYAGDDVKKNVIFIPVSNVSDIISSALVHKKGDIKAPIKTEYKQKTAALSQ